MLDFHVVGGQQLGADIVLAVGERLVEGVHDEEDALVVPLETAADTKGLATVQALAAFLLHPMDHLRDEETDHGDHGDDPDD